MERRMFLAQRISALVLAPLVLVHAVLILWAVQDGLSAAEILGRTQGSVIWAVFYTVFVVAAAVHAPIGVRNVLREWTPLPRWLIDIAVTALGIGLLLAGLRAVLVVTL